MLHHTRRDHLTTYIPVADDERGQVADVGRAREELEGLARSHLGLAGLLLVHAFGVLGLHALRVGEHLGWDG